MPAWISVLLSLLPMLLNSNLGKAIVECLATQTGWKAIGLCILSKIATDPPPPGTAEHHAAQALKTAIEANP